METFPPTAESYAILRFITSVHNDSSLQEGKKAGSNFAGNQAGEQVLPTIPIATGEQQNLFQVKIK